MINITFDYWAVFARGQEARRKVNAAVAHGISPEINYGDYISPCDLKLIDSEAKAWEDGYQRPDFVQ